MEKKNIIDTLEEVGFLKQALAELISSDVLTSKEACEEALEHLKRFKADLSTSRKKDDLWLNGFLVKADHIIRHDLAEFIKESDR